MATPVTSAEFRKLLTKGIRKVIEDKWKALPSKRDQLYNVMTSDKAVEQFYAIGSVPDIPVFTGLVNYLPIHPGYSTQIEPAEYAGGLMFERKLLDDLQYNVMTRRAEKLVTAAARTQEKVSVRPFAYAFSSAFDYMVSEEGVALCSNSHLTKSGTSTANGFDNLGTSALSKTSVAATRIAMRQFRDDISERIDVGDDLCLVVPDSLEEAAYEIVKTPKGLDTEEGNVNFQYGKYEIITLPRLDDYDTKNWFMGWKSQMKQDLIWIDRVKPETKTTWDFDSYILKLALYMRFANGWIDWRWCFGNQVS